VPLIWELCAQGVEVKYFLLAAIVLVSETIAAPQLQDSFTITSASFEEPWERYKVAIFPDGITVLIIENDAAAARSFQIPNSEETFQKILNVLDQYQFLDFDDSYGLHMNDEIDPKCKELWSHSSFSVFSLQYAGEEKTIFYDHGCRGFLREIELKAMAKSVKDIIGVSDYVGT
tara:strand:- start:1406 stop:1927 length:522 start_codon:yes stop_codon:yes gene_type:complete